jgi:hypothetical protein
MVVWIEELVKAGLENQFEIEKPKTVYVVKPALVNLTDDNFDEKLIEEQFWRWNRWYF